MRRVAPILDFRLAADDCDCVDNFALFLLAAYTDFWCMYDAEFDGWVRNMSPMMQRPGHSRELPAGLIIREGWRLMLLAKA